MVVLMVYAHQSSGSLNAADKEAAVEALKDQGCTVDVSDLYAIESKATATAEENTGSCSGTAVCRTASCTTGASRFWLLRSSGLLSEARGAMLEGRRTRLQGVLEEKPLSFPPSACFDGQKGFQLKPEVHEPHAAMRTD
ncbi:Ribosyldihydronicotinamide dehydrogenase [quinone] [Liparis tanakae]|uniref:Ribosyldihydronicotinamide dehydrogenase [quinone] n=1 Tax=Liparis tanakae TaxID=230148 RepID=A0A4Z2FGQ8_9TELE|nr:Ribosyldihydronicotinamide dehydrogenase [quinone] [Liparis tanakae]